MTFDFEKYIEKLEKDALDNKIGEKLAKGMEVGLSDNSYLAITALKNVYVELETLSKDEAKNAEKLEKKRQERELKNLKNSLDLKLITEKEYYEKLKAYRDENLREGSDLWYELTEKIARYNQSLEDEALEEYKKACEEQIKYAEKQLGVVDEQLKIIKEQFKIYEKINEFENKLAASLKQNTEPLVTSSKAIFRNINPDGSDQVYESTHLHDFQEEINMLGLYKTAVLELKKLGYFPEEFFSEIADMDVEEAAGIMQRILGASEESRRQFADGYRTRNALAEGVASDLNLILNKEALEKAGVFSTEEFVKALSEIINVKNFFTEQLEGNYDYVPEGYYKLGEAAGEAFAEGLEENVKNAFLDARQSVIDVINEIAGEFVLYMHDIRDADVGNMSNIYTNNYNFNSSKDTTTEQLAAARAASIIEKLRGGV